MSIQRNAVASILGLSYKIEMKKPSFLFQKIGVKIGVGVKIELGLKIDIFVSCVH